MMLAQRYPDAYDGIMAGAPGIYWPAFLASGQWPQQVINTLGSYPSGCKLDTITAAAITAYDGFDRVVEGVIGEVDTYLGTFSPFDLIGNIVNKCPQAPDQGPIRIARPRLLLPARHGRGPLSLAMVTAGCGMASALVRT